jgi:hypothetical protein
MGGIVCHLRRPFGDRYSDIEKGKSMIAGFLFGLGLIAAFVVVANIQVIGMIALVLIAAAAALGGVIYLVSNPEILRNLGFGLLITAFLALIIAGMSVINNKLAVRMDPKRAQWIMIGVFCALPPVIIGLGFLAWFIAVAIHGPYG